MTIKFIKPLSILSLLLLLTACTGIAVSPEAAATQMLLKQTTAGMTVNQDSLEVRQILKVNHDQTIVLLSFKGVRPEMGPVACLYTYQTLRRFPGWISANGGGGCHNAPAERDLKDLDVTAGHYSGEKPLDPGYTLVFGDVNNEDIVKVRVNWDDNQLTEVDVVNATILSMRSGDQMINALEGLDADGEVVFRTSFSFHGNSQPSTRSP
jgi:hypothetical protein